MQAVGGLLKRHIGSLSATGGEGEAAAMGDVRWEGVPQGRSSSTGSWGATVYPAGGQSCKQHRSSPLLNRSALN